MPAIPNQAEHIKDQPPLKAWLGDTVHQLQRLAHELRNSPMHHEPDIFATCEALECAATLLRARQPGPDPRQTAKLLHDAVALARSTVEAAKYTARDRYPMT